MKRIIYATIITFFIHVTAMEEKNIIIVDANEQHELSTKIKNSSPCISIFGATPRYTVFEAYSSTLKKHYDELRHLHEQKKSIKCYVGKTVKLMELKPYDESFTQLFELQVPLMKLFLEQGIEKKKIAQNISTLLETASKGHVLIHSFFPSYFVGAPQDKNKIYSFLKQCALFYKNLYSACNTTFRIVVFIPPLEYFTTFIEQKNYNEKSITTSIQQILQKEIIEKLPKSCVYGLINQDKDENELLCKILSENVTQKIINVPLQLYLGAQQSKIFTPYILLKDKKYTSVEEEMKHVCLVNKLVHTEIIKFAKEIDEKNKK